MKLRNYQKRTINEVLNNLDKRKILVNACVGSGKSIMISSIAKELSKNKQVVIGTDISALVPQLKNTLNSIGIEPTVVSEGKIISGKDNVVLGLEQTLINRKAILESNAIIILDEAHKRFDGKRLQSLIEYIEPSNIIGFTGTPFDSNGVKMKDWFYINSLTLKEGIEQGYLRKVEYRINKIVKELDFESLEDNAKNNLDYREEDIRKLYDNENFKKAFLEFFKEKYNGEQTLIFVANIKMAENFKKLLQEVEPTVAVVHSKQKQETNKENIEAYKRNEIKILISVTSLTIGFDAPNTEVGYILRPTKSYNLFFQIDGRFRRIHPTKGVSEPSVVYDFTDNLIRFGLPEEFEPFETIEQAKDAKKKRTIIQDMIDILDEKEIVVTEDSIKEFKIKIEELKQHKELTPMELYQLFLMSNNVEEILDLAIKMYKVKFGIDYSNSYEWILEPMKHYLEKLDIEFNKYNATIKAYKTRILNILKNGKKLTSMHYFPEWFYNEVVKKYSINF